MVAVLMLLLSLSPEHKQLLTMVKQGDMIAADELATGVCGLPEEQRRKIGQEVLDRLKNDSGPAPELALKGVKACMPKEAPAEAKKAPETKKAPEAKPEVPPVERDSKASKPAPPPAKIEDKRADASRRPVEAEPPAAESTRRPVVADPAPSASPAPPAPAAAPARAVDASPEPARDAAPRASAAALPDGDVDEEEPAPEGEVEVAMASATEEEPLPELAPIPAMTSSGGAAVLGDRSVLREAMTYYSIGGGLVAVGAVGALAAVGSLANGAYLVSQLAPLQQSNPQAYQTQSAALWTTWGLLGGAAAITAAAAAGGGVALMWMGGDRVDQM